MRQGLEAGLYDANDVMLCSWEESGIDATTTYTSSTYKSNNASPYYVITNNYPDTVKVVISDSVTSIGDYAFSNCDSLTSIEIPDSVSSIRNTAFYGCTSLATIYIPSSVTRIATNKKYSNSPFYNCRSSLKIYCGASAKKSGWETYWNYYNSSSGLSIKYGVTREEYEANYK